MENCLIKTLPGINFDREVGTFGILESSDLVWLMEDMIDIKTYISSSQEGATSTSRGHLAMSGDIFGDPNWGVWLASDI